MAGITTPFQQRLDLFSEEGRLVSGRCSVQHLRYGQAEQAHHQTDD